MTSAQWLQLLLSYCLQSTLVIAVAWLLDRWTIESNAKARIWTACFVSLLGVLAAGLLLPRLHWLHPWSELEPTSLLAVAEVEHIVARLLLVVWFLGIGVMFARAIIEFWRVQRFVASCSSLTVSELALVHSIVAKGSLSQRGRTVQLRISPEALGPFCYQFHQPMVFIPRSLLTGDATELTHVLEHELTHLRTQHPLQLFLQKTVQCVLWFHPLVWMSAGRARLVREFVCDDAAAHGGVSTASYLRTLLKIVEQKSTAQSSLLAIGRSVSEVRARAERLASHTNLTLQTRSTWSALALLLTAVVVSQLWLPTDPLVSARSRTTPWPTWSARVLHELNLPANDFQPFDARTQWHELREEKQDLLEVSE